MTEFAAFIKTHIQAEIFCAGCRTEKSFSGCTVGGTALILNDRLLEAGWRVWQNRPYCPGCFQVVEARRL